MATLDTSSEAARGFMRLMAGRESLSGPGSSMAATEEVRAWLPGMLYELGARSLADVPCGDHHWLSTVNPSVREGHAISYIGYDILPELVEANRRKYPQRRFEVLNAITDVPAPADCILCRDLLVHLSYAHALAAPANFRKSGATWLIATTFPREWNRDLPEMRKTLGWRPLNMEAEPFNLVSVDGIREVVAGAQWERWLGVYRLN